MIERVVKSQLLPRLTRVIVVVGHEAQKVMEAFSNFNCKFVFNGNFSVGQSSSVKVGG